MNVKKEASAEPKKESRTSRIIKRIINIRQWMDYERLKAFTNFLINGIKKLLIPSPATAPDQSFQTAVKKLRLNDQQIIDKQLAFLHLSRLMCIVASFIFIYCIYLAIYGSWRAVAIGFVVAIIAIVLAIRYHFWFYQIKERKLGCTFSEWFRRGLMGIKDE